MQIFLMKPTTEDMDTSEDEPVSENGVEVPKKDVPKFEKFLRTQAMIS